MGNIAIITARGGSKRIPKKNIKHFLGKPIISYSIEAAIGSLLFDETMVSTDDEQIANVAKDYGAVVPFMRSAQTSDDYSTTTEVLIEVLNEYKKSGRTFEFACCIYPTAPFVTSKKLTEAYKQLIESKSDSIIPVTRFSFPIWRSFKMEENKIKYNWPEFATKRSQDLKPAFHDCGQFYFFNVESFFNSRKLVTDNTIGLEVPELETQDIDNEEDWKLAEIKFDFLYRMKQIK